MASTPQILKMLNRNPQQGTQLTAGIGRLKSLIRLAKAAKYPTTAIQQMVADNPQLKEVMDFVQQSGADPKELFYKLAAQKGVDPNEILDMLK